MSMPNIPDIKPNINLNRCEIINLLLSSIALEEIGLSHILNAEGEKLQAILKLKPASIDTYLKANNSVNKMLRTIVKSQTMLQLKLEDVMELAEESNCSKPCPKPCKGCSKLDCSCKKFNC